MIRNSAGAMGNVSQMKASKPREEKRARVYRLSRGANECSVSRGKRLLLRINKPAGLYDFEGATTKDVISGMLQLLVIKDKANNDEIHSYLR